MDFAPEYYENLAKVKEYNKEPSMDASTGQWYDADGNPIDDPNSNPEFASMIKPIAAVKEDLVKKQSWYKSPLKLKQNTISTALSEGGAEKIKAFKDLKSKVGSGGLTVEKYLNLSKAGKIPSIIAEDLNEQVLEAIEEQGGFGETFQKNWSTGVVEPTFKDGVLDIDESKLEDKEAEKYLHVAKGGVARKNYYHGGILDINESEEIISDDGNDIELTAYNAEFDDPNDLSTGVKSLFQAKDGGGDFDVKKKYKKSNLVTAPHYWKSAPDHPGTELAYITKPEKDLLLKADLHNSLNGKPNKGPAGIISLNGWESDFSSDWGGEAAPQGAGPGTDPGPGKSVWKDVDTGDASIAEDIAAKERKRRQDFKDLIARGNEEKYDTEEQMISDKWTHDTVAGETKRGRYKIDRDTQLYEKALADQKAKLSKMGKGKLVPAFIVFALSGFNPAAALRTLTLSKEDMLTIVKNGIPVMQAKNNLKKTIGEVKEKYKE